MLPENDVIFSRSLSGFKLDTYTVQTRIVRFVTVSFIKHCNAREDKLSPIICNYVLTNIIRKHVL